MPSAEFLNFIEQSKKGPPMPDDIAAAREVVESAMSGLPPAQGVRTEMVTAGERPALWVEADPESPGDTGSLKVLLYLHGGGYRVGSPKAYRTFGSHLSSGLGVPVLIVDYRLAPENPFPAAVEDAVSAYRWLLEQGHEGANIAVAGDSAGGGLAASLLVAIRDEGLPQPCATVCFSPWSDLTMSGDSYTRCVDTDPLTTRETISSCARDYVPDEAGRCHPLASPLFADFKGTSPVFIQAAENELLADDASGLADVLRRDGVEVELELWPDMAHVFQGMTPVIPESREAVARAVGFILKHARAKADA